MITKLVEPTPGRSVRIEGKIDYCDVTVMAAGIHLSPMDIQADEVFDYLKALEEAFRLLSQGKEKVSQ